MSDRFFGGDDDDDDNTDGLSEAEQYYRDHGIDLNWYPQPKDDPIFNIFEEMGWDRARDAMGDLDLFDPANRDPFHDRPGGFFYSLEDAIREVYEYTPIIEFTDYYYEAGFWHLYVRDSSSGSKK